ncbi:MAG: helix-turn-helix transcriptional regulator, partial [Planctomycetales bacterium]|nr:helix-turn-helix transcriptional regulator [Planctomycetales bacterium]
SKHMSILHQSGLVEQRKDGRWAYFRLADDGGSPEVHGVLALVLAGIKRDKQGRADQQQLKSVLRLKPEELCRKQASCKC